MKTYSISERGVLLLCSDLGDPSVTPLRVEQFQRLQQQLLLQNMSDDFLQRELTAADLQRLGLRVDTAKRMLRLMNRETELTAFLHRLERENVEAITRVSPEYPEILRARLGADAPMVLFCIGDAALLKKSAISVVGSRKMQPDGEKVASTIGRRIAEQGSVLCSGGAAGVDTTAALACLTAHGAAVMYLAGDLLQERKRQAKWIDAGGMVLVMAASPFVSFCSCRALERNTYIHAHGMYTVVCQCSSTRSGTWSGTIRNLKRGFSPVYVADHSGIDISQLLQLGARPLEQCPLLCE